MYEIKPLTARQKAVFEFIMKTIKEKNLPPTVREIAEHFGFSSPRAASDHLDALERKGYIRRPQTGWRNIEVPEDFRITNV